MREIRILWRMKYLSNVVNLRGISSTKRFWQSLTGASSDGNGGTFTFIFAIWHRELFDGLLNRGSDRHPLATCRNTPIAMPLLLNYIDFAFGSFFGLCWWRTVEFIGAPHTLVTIDSLIFFNLLILIITGQIIIFDNFWSSIPTWIFLLYFVENYGIVPNMRQIQLWWLNYSLRFILVNFFALGQSFLLE